MDAAEASAEQRTAAAAPDLLTGHGLEVTRYARMIVSGEIVACMWVRHACQRHLDDLAKSEDPSYPFRFDPVKAGRIIAWLELMPYVEGGPWPTPTLRLALWQKFIYGSIFGWVKKESGLRRFSKAFIFVPRKNGKTTPLAGVGFFGMVCDGELGAQIWNGANKRDQAELLFGPAKAMWKKAEPWFRKLGIVKRGENALWMESTNSFWKPTTRSPGDGGGAHYWFQDEYHEAPDSRLRDTMIDGQAARRQPIAIFISTFGHNMAGPCYSDWLLIQKLLQGTIKLDHVFAIAYTIDLEPYIDPFGVKQPADDWTTEAAGRKANPNWGVSVDVAKYLSDLKEAIEDPAKQTTFKTKRLNIWCNAAAGFYNLQQWTACGDASLKIEQFAGESCIEGLDLANKLDLCAAVKLFRRDLPGVDPETGEACTLDHYYAFLRAWLPEAVALRPENTHFRGWADGGFLKATKGNITNYGLILKDLDDGAKDYRLEELDFDQRESGFLMQEFERLNLSLQTFEVPQQVLVLSEPMKWLKTLIVSGRLHHDGNPLLTWAISNVVATEDANKNVFPRKAADELKIDPHSALLNAAVRAREVLLQPAASFEAEVWS